MPISLARLDYLVAETERKVAEQAARVEVEHNAGRVAGSARYHLTILRLDLEIYRNSRDAIAEARWLMGLGRR